MFADLHTHTTASDGRLAPRDLVAKAREAGLGLLAITDHDTVGGVDEALAAAAEQGGIRVIPGVENSTKFHGKTTVHLLAYFPGGVVPDEYRAFLERKSRQREARLGRILAALDAHGVHVERAEVEALADGVVGRPHIAQALVNNGVVASVQEAFDRWLGDGQPGYAPLESPETADVVAAVRAAGGLTSVAHPYQTRLSLAGVEAMLVELRAAGLDAVECFHSDHDRAGTEALLALAGRLGLAVSGGSDFHGIPGHNVVLGLADREPDLRFTLDAAKAMLRLE